MAKPTASPPWHVPVALSEVPEEGRHIALIADAAIRAAVARLAGLRDLPRLEASFDLARRGEGLRVSGQVSATVGQTCVVTLEPIENAVMEAFDLTFLPGGSVPEKVDAAAEIAFDLDDEDAPEVLVNNGVDLGAIATEFLILGLDPYPRKPGAVFQSPQADDDSAKPFAGLAALQKRQRPQ